jgi:hypothetical protein
VVCHRRGLFESAAVLEIGGDPGCAETVVAELGFDPGRRAYASPYTDALEFGLPQRLPGLWTCSWPSYTPNGPEEFS